MNPALPRPITPARSRGTRSKKVVIRITPDEFDQLQIWADESNFTGISTLIRHQLFIASPHIPQTGLNRKLLNTALTTLSALQRELTQANDYFQRVAPGRISDQDLQNVAQLYQYVLKALDDLKKELRSQIDVAAQLVAKTDIILDKLDAIHTLAKQAPLRGPTAPPGAAPTAPQVPAFQQLWQPTDEMPDDATSSS